MSETVFTLITTYSVYVIFASAFLSCLLLPLPTSLMMLAGGAFVASGDLVLWQVIVAAHGGAIIGDQIGYLIGRHGGAPLLEKVARSPTRAVSLRRARALVDRYGAFGVFFSKSLTAPLGPWVNLIAGATGLSWRRFAISDLLGETVWVSLYVSLGFVFSSQISAVADIMSNVIGLTVAMTVAVATTAWIRLTLRRSKNC
ncbi:MAG: DedA family protein [Geminicoccaceae bacterium]